MRKAEPGARRSSATSSALPTAGPVDGRQPTQQSRRLKLALVCVSLVFGVLICRYVLKVRLDAALGDAVVQNDSPRFRALIDAGADPRGVVARGDSGSPLDRLLVWAPPPKAGTFTVNPHHPPVRTAELKPRSLLAAAVVTGNIAMVRELISRGADVNYVDDKGRTPLFWLCSAHRNLDCLDELLQHGALVNVRMNDGAYPLHLAAHANSAAVIRRLAEHGANIQALDGKGLTPLAVAAVSQSGAAVATLLNLGGHRVDLNGPDRTPLLEWTASEPLSLFSRFWEKEISPEERGVESAGAMYNAVRVGNTPVVRYLLERGVGVNNIPIDLDYAYLHGRGRMTLQAQSAANTEAFAASRNMRQDLSMSAITLSVGAATAPARMRGQGGGRARLTVASAPVQSRHGSKYASLLVPAAVSGDPALFKLLLDRGAHPNATDSQDVTPLIASVKKAIHVHAANVSRPLLDSPAEKAQLEKNAAQKARDWRELVRELLNRGADVQAADASGKTALMSAVGDPVIVEMLIAHGANVNARDGMGRTALTAEPWNMNPASVERLLIAGARPNDRDTQGITPLLAAVLAYRPDETAKIARLLLKYGANPNARNSNPNLPGVVGKTALMILEPSMQTQQNTIRHPERYPGMTVPQDKSLTQIEADLRKAGAARAK